MKGKLIVAQRVTEKMGALHNAAEALLVAYEQIVKTLKEQK